MLIRVLKDRRGASAVEFALIAPMLIALYFGLAEYCQALMADRKASHVASSIGDLVAQSSQVTVADTDNIFNAAPTLIAPFANADLKMRVSSVVMTGGKPLVSDSRAKNYVVRAKSSVYTPVNSSAVNPFADPTKPYLAEGESVIVSEVQFTYNSPVKFLIPNGIVLNETFYLRPRKSNVVAFVN